VSRVIAVANHKGGVGKTTTTINLGAAFAEQGKRVLLVDMDPQGSTTKTVGLDDPRLTMFHVLTDNTPLLRIVVPVEWFQLAPADPELDSAQVKLWNVPGRDTILRKKLLETRDEYDVVLIDTPPSLNLLTANALVAADELLAPAECQFGSMAVLPDFFSTVEMVRENVNPALQVAGLLITKYDRRTVTHRQIVEYLREQLAGRYPILETMIPHGIRIQDAALARQSVLRYDSGSAVAAAYRQLAEELNHRG
jgi:chromosome partitioning protein